jgi:hypothetical protein
LFHAERESNQVNQEMRVVVVAVVVALVLAAAQVSAIVLVHPDELARWSKSKPSASSSSGDAMDGTQAQRVYLQLMEALVNANMTALASVCSADLKWIVVGWVPDSQRNAGFCEWRGKDAYVKHVSGFVSMFKSGAAWINRIYSSYDRTFVTLGFTFSGGATPATELVIAPLTHQMVAVKKDADGVYRLSQFIEIGSWHTENGPVPPSAADKDMVEALKRVASSVTTMDIATFGNQFSSRLTANIYPTGMPTAPQPINYTTWLAIQSNNWARTTKNTAQLVSNFGSCRWATAEFILPAAFKDGTFLTSRGLLFAEFDNTTRRIVNFWEGLQFQSKQPFPVPPKPADPVTFN